MSGEERLWSEATTTPDAGITPEVNDKSWDALLIVFEVINILLLVITFWVLLSMVLYGTKTGRWINKAGSSSLKSGMIYTACTIAIGLQIPTMIATEVLYRLPSTESGLDWCEIACDVGNAAFTVSTSAAYIFLWLRLRLIYANPYVKQRVSKYANWFAIFVFVVLVSAGVGLMCFYVIPETYQATPYGCTHRPKNPEKFFDGSARNILIAVVLFFAQSMMMCLAVYPVARVKFEVQDDVEGKKSSGSNRASLRVQHFMSSIRHGDGPKSPIEMAVRRTLISCVVMVASDILALVPVGFVIPRHAPAQLRRTIYNVGSFVNVFCMLATFGFTLRVLTLFCAACPRKRKFKRQKRKHGIVKSPPNQEIKTSPLIG